MKGRAQNIDQLVKNVADAFNLYPWETLDAIWGHLLNCYRSSLASGGGNQYEKPHKGGRKRAKKEGSSVDLLIDVGVYNQVASEFSDITAL